MNNALAKLAYIALAAAEGMNNLTTIMNSKESISLLLLFIIN
ncbi:hypothetical protein [Ferruginibacter sp.]